MTTFRLVFASDTEGTFNNNINLVRIVDLLYKDDLSMTAQFSNRNLSMIFFSY